MTRAVSLLLALSLTLGLMFLPAMRGRDLTPAGHALLIPLLLAICVGFVHGVGYKAQHVMLGRVAEPIFLWPAMAVLVIAWISFS
jgi:predicted membrane protein